MNSSGENGSVLDSVFGRVGRSQAQELFAKIDDDSLKQSLLEPVRSPLRPYRPGELVEMVEKMVAEHNR